MRRITRLLFRSFVIALLTVSCALLTAAPDARAQTESFSYQGRLTDGSGTPLDGTYDLTLKLFDAATGGSQVGTTITKSGVTVSDGLFKTSLNFGTESFADGAPRWLEISVDDGSGVETLTPRTKLEAAPSALSMPGVTVDANGQVGINQINPTSQLHVSSDAYPFRAVTNTSNYLAAVYGEAAGTDANAAWLRITDSSNDKPVVLAASNGTGEGVYANLTNASNSDAAVFGSHSGTGPAIYGRALGSGEAGRFRGGDVSVLDGSGNPELAFQTNQTNSAGQLSMFSSGGTETFEVVADELGNDGAELRLRKDDGTTSITLDAEYNNGGPGRITTDEMQLNGSDLAEHFDVRAPMASASTPEAGMVVSIDPARPGKLIVSSKAHDRTVAGIISGAGGVRPGIHMGQEGTLADGDRPVAVAGRVYVRTDASEGGSIEPGDLLTTASTPGHAMKVTNHDKARGAILGKAMTGLEEGTGLVLILVSLQ